MKKGRNWVISASGGVQFFPWMVADQTEESSAVDAVRDKVAAVEKSDNWWW
jgi:ferritin